MGQQQIVRSEGTQYGGYPGRFAFRSVREQFSRFRDLFPDIPRVSFASEITEREPPRYFEWAIRPKWEILGATPVEALERVFAKITEVRLDRGGFCNHCEGKLGPGYLQQTVRTKAAFEQIAADQKGHDILVMAAQVGRRHRRRSVDESRAAFWPIEFGLDTLSVAVPILLHPEWFGEYENHGIDCAGDEYVTGSVVDCARSPCFFVAGGKLRFDVGCTRNKHPNFSSASGLVLQLQQRHS